MLRHANAIPHATFRLMEHNRGSSIWINVVWDEGAVPPCLPPAVSNG